MFPFRASVSRAGQLGYADTRNSHYRDRPGCMLGTCIEVCHFSSIMENVKSDADGQDSAGENIKDCSNKTAITDQ